MNAPFYRVLSLPRVHFLTPENARPVSAATFSILASKLLIALWLLLDTPTRLPAAISAQMTCALVCVLPVPGGPWMNKLVSSIARQRNVAASIRLSSSRTKAPPSQLVRRGFSRSMRDRESDERRVGQGCGRTCRDRGWPDN